MTMVTVPQGIDLGRMRCVHEIYLNVLHGIITFDEGSGRLEEVMSREKRYCDSLCVLMCELTPHILWCKILDAKLRYVQTAVPAPASPRSASSADGLTYP